MIKLTLCTFVQILVMERGGRIEFVNPSSLLSPLLPHHLLGGHGAGLGPHPLLVVSPVLTKAGVGLGLGGVLDVGVVEEVLDTEEDLLDGDGRPPVLLLVQD